MTKIEEVQFCKNCVYYENSVPEDLCHSSSFEGLDVITGKKIINSCLAVRTTLNPNLKLCSGYRDIRKEH